MGKGVLTALEALDARKIVYSEFGVNYWQPWLIKMTDGKPGDNISKAVSDVAAQQMAGKLVVIPLGVGQDVRLDILAQFSPGRTPSTPEACQ